MSVTFLEIQTLDQGSLPKPIVKKFEEVKAKENNVEHEVIENGVEKPKNP